MINNIAMFEWKINPSSGCRVKEYTGDAVFIAIGREGGSDEVYDTFILMREDGSIETRPVGMCKIIASVSKLGVKV